MKLVGKKSAWEYLILMDYIWYETSLLWAFGLLFCFQPPHIKIISKYPWVSKVTCIRLQGRRWTPSKVEDKHGVGEMPKWEIWHNDFQLWTLEMYCGYTCLVPSWHYFSVRWKQPAWNWLLCCLCLPEAEQHHFSWSSQLQQDWKKQSKSYTCSLRIMTISTGLLLTYWLAVWITHIIRHLGQGQAHLPRHRTHAGWGGPMANWFMGLMGDLGLSVSHPCERKAWLNVNSIQHPLVRWYYNRFIYTAMSHTPFMPHQTEHSYYHEYPPKLPCVDRVRQLQRHSVAMVWASPCLVSMRSTWVVLCTSCHLDVPDCAPSCWIL